MGCRLSRRKGRPHPTVLLLWVRTHLSTNILREINLYLRGPFLADICSTQLSIFDVGTRTWRTTPLKLDCEPVMSPYYLLLSPHEVFLAGNAMDAITENSKAFIFSVLGTIRRLPDMLLSGYPGPLSPSKR